jgi:hypothetical protein
MTTNTDNDLGYSIVHPDSVEDAYAGSDVPGEFRRLGESDEPVEMWAISRKLGNGDATKLDHFWESSPAARQTRS